MGPGVREGATVAISSGWVNENRIVRLDKPFRAIKPGMYFLCVEDYEPYLLWIQGTFSTIRVVSALVSTVPLEHHHV